MSGLPMGTYALLKAGYPVYLRTRVHPAAQQLEEDGLAFTSFDDLYESATAFEEVYMKMAERLVAASQQFGEIVYAVPGHPLIAEQSVQNLYGFNAQVDVQIGPGQSFIDAVCTVLKVDPIEGFVLLDGTMLRETHIQPGLHTFIAQVFQPAVASEVKLTLMNVLPDDYPLTVVRAAGVAGAQRVEKVPLFALDRVSWIDHLTTVYVPASTSPSVRQRDLWHAAELVETLRMPGGCPWDRKQTHETLRPYVIEEAFEVASAIDMGDPDELMNELGDLLLQVLLHAQIASEFGEFNLRDVFAALSDKLIRRHPHVFGDVQAHTAEEAELAWNASKQQERETEGVLANIKLGRPATVVANDVQTRVAKVGFDWQTVSDVLDKLKEEMIELEAEVKRGDREKTIEELGDIAFTTANLARWLEVDIETVLAKANLKFIQRFSRLEHKMYENGKKWTEMNLESLECLWNDVKKAGK